MIARYHPDEFTAKMREIYPTGAKDSDLDIEGAHAAADGLMCRLLRSLGYSDGVDIFRDAPKWYV